MINVVKDDCANKLICSTLQDINQIQMGLDFEINSYRGISDACPGVVFLPGNHHFNNYCFLHGKPKEDQIFIVAIAKGCIFSERISLLTRNGERVFLKVNCRENLTMSTAPFHLCVKECEDKDVGDVAIIKFIESTSGPLPTSYIAVCEGLILRKFLLSYMGVFSFVWVRSPLMKKVSMNVRS